MVQDQVIAIDLEWRPDRGRNQSNRVAMIQLASKSVAVLVRTCKLGFRLGYALEDFLRSCTALHEPRRLQSIDLVPIVPADSERMHDML